MNIFNQIAGHFKKVSLLSPGIHHGESSANEKHTRIHLRLQRDGSGILLLNASTVLQLNPTAAEYAYHYIKGTSPEEAARQISSRYRVNKRRALEDYHDFVDQIQELLYAPDVDPVSFLNFERAQPHSADAVLRLDCAITYRLPESSHAGHAPVQRVERELTTTEWQAVIDKSWQAGIPHIIFTGGEATLREDLPQLIAHVEKNGQVCGLLTDGIKLADESYLKTLLQTGLDHVMLLLQPDDPRSWAAITTIIPQDLCLTIHFTVHKEDLSSAEGVLQKLADLGVQNISLSAADESISDAVLQLQTTAQSLSLTLRWDLPVPYSSSNPVSWETLEDEIPSGAGRTWMYVEPDGDVLSAQGKTDSVLGNILLDDWEEVLKHSAG